MAEQIGHNVVNNFQSASGSPFADVAVNQKSVLAVSDSNSPSTNVDSNTSQSSTPFGKTTNSDVGEPSAGNDAYAGRLEPQSALHDVAVQGRANDVHDDASQGEGVADDRSLADGSIDASANSDTDTSRADIQERKDASSHNRTNSMKKPATFSKVSVTRNFLAKTATAPTGVTSVKPGEKVSVLSVAALSAAKPRLVAKSGTALQNVQRLRPGADGSGGPDGSKVWNKNQPTRPPPPKQFTDEELKQQYGIHLANRLQSDEGGNESKWADIDEDEDDWAPEAVTWVDGTKSTLNIQESAPAAAPKTSSDGESTKEAPGNVTAAPLSQAPPQPAAPQKLPSSTPPPAAASSRPPPQIEAPASARPALTSMKRPEQHMKILRPGAAASMAKQNNATIGSASSDKPSLKAKSSAPPTKSPWAPVPKVESVSPINPPIQQTTTVRPLATQDARAYESATAAQPAREIAADTFDRSWRENEKGNRELYNSANGRYEPVPEGRRGNGRLEPSVRKPALLQRSAPGNETPESNQAQIGSQQDVGQGRRRGSSVSQTSAPQNRHIMANKVPEVLEHSAESATDVPQTAAVGPIADSSSVWAKQMPPQNVAPAEPSISVEDALKMQERVMREKRELAIKRRKEEEEREANAKQERLRAKLAALEGAGKSKKDREAEAAAAASTATKTVEDADARPNNASKIVAPTPPSAAVTESAPAAPQADARPYERIATKQPLTDSKAQKANTSDRQLLDENSTITPEGTSEAAARSRLLPEPHNRDMFASSGPAFTSPPSFQQNPSDRKAQTAFGRSPNLASESTFSPWPKALSSTSVWGTSGIGNGTFDSSSNFAPLMGPSAGLPPPTGMSLQPTSRISPKTFPGEERSANMQQHQSPAQTQAPTSHSSESRKFASGIDSRGDMFANQSRLHVGSPAPGLGRPVHLPGPIGPPSRAHLQNDQTKSNSSLAQWHNLANEMPNQFRGHAEDNAVTNPNDVSSKSDGHIFRETFKKIAPAGDGRLGMPRRFESTEYTVHDKEGMSRAPLASSGRHATPLAPWAAPGANPIALVEGPEVSAQRNAISQQPPIAPPPSSSAQSAVLPPHLRPKAKFPTTPIESVIRPHGLSPPPPETESHPVNTGDVHHPQVRLPPPQARVRLPPSSAQLKAHASAQSAPNMTTARQPNNFGPPGANRPLVQNADWQLRFNGLFGRAAVSTETPPSPPKTPPKSIDSALAVAASSRMFMDDHHHTLFQGATVSLPSPKRTFTGAVVSLNSRGPFTKPISDYLFDEERSFGSRPVVVVPRNPRYKFAPHEPVVQNLPTSKDSRMSRATAFEAQSKESLPAWVFYKNPLGFHLKIPGTRLNNKLVKHTRVHDDSANARTRRTQDRPGYNKPEKAKGTKSNSNAPVADDEARKSGISEKATVRPSADNPTPSSVTRKAPVSFGAEKKTTWTKSARGGPRRSSTRPAAVSSS